MSRRTIQLIRWGVFLLAGTFLYLRLAGGTGGADLASAWALLGENEGALVIGGVMLLMLVNWGLESRKWRILVRQVEALSVGRAFAATIAGTSIGLITPNRVGEFVGRVLFLAPEHRVAASFATAVGSIAQFVTTVVLGLAGLMAMALRSGGEEAVPYAFGWIGLCGLVAAGTLLLYFNPDLLRAVLARVPVVRRWERHAGVLERFGPVLLLRVLGLSAARYAVFTLQFALLLGLLAGIGPGQSLPVIPAVFLLSTLIPTVMLTELGVRGSVAVALLAAGPPSDQGVFIASLVLWVVNLAIPAVAGSLLLLVAKIRTTAS